MKKMTLQRWYGRSVPVPTLGTQAYVPFAASCIGLVRSIVEDNLGKSIRVRLMDEGTAAANRDENVIHINRLFFTGCIPDRKTRHDSDTTTTAILGIIVHEAGHFAWSPKTLEPFVQYVKENTRCAFYPMAAGILANIVEDIYIEAEIDRVVPNLSWTLETVNGIFFPDSVAKDRLREVERVFAAPNKVKLVGDVLNAVLLAKTRETIHSTPYITNLFNQALGAKEMPKIADRYALTLSLYDQIMLNLKDESESEESLSGVKASAEGVNAPHEESKKEPTSLGSVGRELEQVIERLDEARVGLEKAGVIDYRGEELSILVIEEPLKPSEEPLPMDERYLKLAEVARQHAVVNRPYGLDKKRGTHVRKLHRIATDSKIFAEPVSMNSYKPMQVAILVDCSGSMERSGAKRSNSRIQEATVAALGAAYGLVQARCDVAVYGHTADYVTKGNDVQIFRAKGFQEPINGLAEKMMTMNNGIMHYENRDGLAVAYVAKKLADSRRKRLLIVISDGQPSATSYRGRAASEHTKGEVEKARQKGIDVMSISITEEANEVNNEIYGKDRNLFNADPNIIEDVVRKLMGV